MCTPYAVGQINWGNYVGMNILSAINQLVDTEETCETVYRLGLSKQGKMAYGQLRAKSKIYVHLQ